MVALARKVKKATKPAKKGGGFGARANGFGKRPPAMPTIKLNTGADVPLLAFGTYRTGGAMLRQALEHAIASGYRHFDTASCYENEAVLGAAIRASQVPREEFFITTKLWCTDHGTERTRRAVEASLKELGTYIDLYLIHGPVCDRCIELATLALRYRCSLPWHLATSANVPRSISGERSGSSMSRSRPRRLASCAGRAGSSWRTSIMPAHSRRLGCLTLSLATLTTSWTQAA